MITATKTARQMKRFLIFLCLGLSLHSLAQSPPLINYQGVVRRSNGNPMAGATLSVKFEILQNATVVYEERKSGISSNALGLFNTQIGSGTPVIGTLAGINWGSGPFFLRVGIDTTNGSSFTQVGTPQQLVSVPYALHAASAPAPAVSYSNSILSVGGNTVTISAGTNTAGTITGSTNVTAISDINANYTITVNPTLTVNNNNLSISGGNTVPMTSVSATGASTATATAYGYDISTDPVTLTNGVPLLGTLVTGILQINGTYPNYTLGVAPYLQYSSTTGSLTMTNLPGTSPAFSAPGVNITPTVGLIGPILNIGPTANNVDFTNITPWRTAPLAPLNVTLATTAASVGIGALASPPTAKLHVDGYTRLGGTAPAVKMEKITGFQTAATQGGSTSIPITGFTTGAKVLSVSVMVELTNGSGNWIPPGYVNSPNFLYTWQLTGTSIDVYNVAANSAGILGNNIRVLVTYEQ